MNNFDPISVSDSEIKKKNVSLVNCPNASGLKIFV